MYYKLLGCKMLEREIASVAFCTDNVIDVTTLQLQLHETPKLLQKALQEEIDQIDANQHRYSNNTNERDYDAILLGYGLCSNAVTGLSSKKYPLVIPKAHDCVTMLMGSKEQYMDYYMKHPGTFYYSPGFAEFTRFNDEEQRQRRYELFLAKSKGNEKRAKRMMEIEDAYTSSYKQVTYIDWPTIQIPRYKASAQALAQEKSWSYEDFQGSNCLLMQLVNGDWPEEDFLIVPPGHHAEPSFDENVLKEV